MTQTGPAVTAGALYEQVGSANAVRNVVDDPHTRTSDRRPAPYFTKVDMSQQKRHMPVFARSRDQVVTRPGDPTSERTEVV